MDSYLLVGKMVPMKAIGKELYRVDSVIEAYNFLKLTEINIKEVLIPKSYTEKVVSPKLITKLGFYKFLNPITNNQSIVFDIRKLGYKVKVYFI